MNEQPILTMADYSELWMREMGYKIPERDSEAWQKLYEQWVEYAFDNNKWRRRNAGVE
jgi:hypothetical protein